MQFHAHSTKSKGTQLQIKNNWSTNPTSPTSNSIKMSKNSLIPWPNSEDRLSSWHSNPYNATESSNILPRPTHSKKKSIVRASKKPSKAKTKTSVTAAAKLRISTQPFLKPKQENKTSIPKSEPKRSSLSPSKVKRLRCSRTLRLITISICNHLMVSCRSFSKRMMSLKTSFILLRIVLDSLLKICQTCWIHMRCLQIWA